MKKLKKVIFLLLFSFLVLFTFVFNKVCIDINFSNLLNSFRKNEGINNRFDHISLVMKYKNQKKLYEQKISHDEIDQADFKMNVILAEEINKEKKEEKSPSMFVNLTIKVINFIRTMLGKEALTTNEKSELNTRVGVAYYFERNHKYQEALIIYDNVLKNLPLSNSEKYGIYMHQGFCYSIIGEMNKAKEKYQKIINESKDEKIVITTLTLLSYLEGFATEIEKIKSSKDSHIEMSTKLVKLMAFKDALKILNKIEQNKSYTNQLNIEFLKGRIFEELGDTTKAINLYQKVIDKTGNSSFSKSANRRIYLIGSKDINGDKLIKKAVENNDKLHDGAFFELVKNDYYVQSLKNSHEKLREDKKFNKALQDAALETKIKSYNERNTEKPWVIITKNDATIKVGQWHNENQNVLFLKNKSNIIEIDKCNVTLREEVQNNFPIGEEKLFECFQGNDLMECEIKVITKNNDIIIGDLKKTTQPSLEMKTDFGTLTIPRDNILKYILINKKNKISPKADNPPEKPKKVKILMKIGDVLHGLLIKETSHSYILQIEVGNIKLDKNKVQEIFILE